MRAPYLLPLLAACVVGVAGCSGNKASISGTVRLDGELVEEGSINFVPVNGTTGAGAGGIIKNGRYHIPASQGVMVGSNRVELRAFKATGKKVASAVGKRGTLAEERVQAFPPEFSDASKVIKEIHRGANTIDFDVQTKKARK